MEIKEFENKTKNMKEQEKEDKFSLIKNSENNNQIEILENKVKYIVKNYLNDKRLVYHRLEGMEPGEDLSQENSNDTVINVKNEKILYNRKIGNNIVLFKKYVLGTRYNILILFFTMLGMGVTWFGWAYSNKNFYSFNTLIICFISYFITNFFMVLSFLTEPGIIPREHPKYVKTNFEEDEKEENNKEENKEVIPRIFKERFCNTCKIVRPPGTSHCRVCDNCVQNYDHHCYYISSCVGKRNHKYFYLFLFCGTIGSVKMVILGFITIYKLFIINAKETLFIYYREDKTLFIICSVTTILSLFCSMGGLRNAICFVIQFIMSFGLFCYLWFKHFYNKNNNINVYYNPLIIVFYVASLYFFFFVFTTFCGQSMFISSGYTIKQTQSIKNEIIDIVNSRTTNKLKPEYTRKKTFKEKIENIINFLKADISESLIVPERDLID